MFHERNVFSVVSNKTTTGGVICLPVRALLAGKQQVFSFSFLLIKLFTPIIDN